jgi:Xaa-Pro aminopeptidase
MKKKLFLILGLLPVFAVFAQDHARELIAKEDYSARRTNLAAMIDTGSVVAIKGGEENFDDIRKFRQDRDFLYLTGMTVPGARIIVAPKGILYGNTRKDCFIFINRAWYTDLAVPMGASDTLLDMKQFDTVFKHLTQGIRTLYYYPPMAFSHDWINDKVYFAEKEMKKAFEKSHPGAKIKPAATLIAKLRQIKTKDELAAMNKAIELTSDGILSAMRSCKPGMYEYEIQALIEYEAIRQGAGGMGFASIIGGGKNSLIPHYFDNNCEMKAGDLLVMDVGAEYDGYSADITRTIPVSGKFSIEQAIVYNVLLNVQKELIGMVKPGITFNEIDNKSNELIRGAGFGNYILHGVTHTVGLNVHDATSGDTLRAGMVITIEPGIYIPGDDTIQPEGRKGFGIRIEDDVLVTDGGNEVISAMVPKEQSEIEKRMRLK